MFRSFLFVCVLSLCLSQDIIEVTNSNFLAVTKQKKFMLFYVETEDCEECKMKFHKFYVAAQNFQDKNEILFGRVSDEILIETFEVDSFPEVVYYKLGSAIPRRYRGGITVEALYDLVIDEVSNGQYKRSSQKHITLELNNDNSDAFLYNPQYYRLVMLYDPDDDEERKDYEELAQTYENESELIIAIINVQTQTKLRREFRTMNYPTFYWFDKGTAKKRQRSEETTLNVRKMINFINEKTGMKRQPGGDLDNTAGLISSMDDIVQKYIEDINKIRNLETVISKLKKNAAKVKASEKESAEYYVHLLEELEEDRTLDSLSEEKNRLYRRMGDDMRPQENDMVRKKLNIIDKIIDILSEYIMGEELGQAGLFDRETKRHNPDDVIEFHDEF